ncbi:hypothetical protein K502DRAFT_350774 [Neoconidiobolus thromboides FSU 785]|nr:hypothetical protein K502DRAFT_350774 [Neoconidiobolus thromboides FSU 785]
MSSLWKNGQLQICDQCYLSRVKCDKGLPKCIRCVKSDIQCTYLRLTKKKVRAQENPMFYNCINILQMKPRYFNRKRKSLKYLNEDKGIVGTFIQVDNKLTINTTLLMIQKKYNERSFANRFGTLLGLNIFSNIKINNKLEKFYLLSFCSSKIDNKNNFNKSKQYPVTQLNIQKNEVILNKAKLAYFENINTFIPLFLESRYNTEDQPMLLNIAIWLSGLTFLIPSKNVLNLMKQLERVYIHLFQVSRYKSNLYLLQASIVLYFGIRRIQHPFINIENLIDSTIHLSSKLGLHLSPPNISKFHLLERKLTFSALNYIFLIRSFCYDSHSIFSKEDIEQDINCYKLAKTITQSTKELMSIILSDLNYKKAYCFISIYQLKYKRFNNFQQTEILSFYYLNKINKHTFNCYKLISSLINNVITPFQRSMLQNIQLSYLLYVLYVMNYLAIALPKETKVNIKIKYVDTIINLAKHIVNQSSNEISTNSLHFQLGSLSFALNLYIIYCIGRNPLSDQVINRGLAALSYASNSKPANFSAQEMLHLCNLVLNTSKKFLKNFILN